MLSRIGMLKEELKGRTPTSASQQRILMNCSSEKRFFMGMSSYGL